MEDKLINAFIGLDEHQRSYANLGFNVIGACEELGLCIEDLNTALALEVRHNPSYNFHYLSDAQDDNSDRDTLGKVWEGLLFSHAPLVINCTQRIIYSYNQGFLEFLRHKLIHGTGRVKNGERAVGYRHGVFYQGVVGESALTKPTRESSEFILYSDKGDTMLLHSAFMVPLNE